MSFTCSEEWQSKRILELFSLQTVKMDEVVKNLGQTVLLLLDGEYQKMLVPASVVTSLEKECDRIKEVLVKKVIEEESPLPVAKVDFLKIVQKVDGIVNQADLIAHKISIHEVKFPPSLAAEMKDLVKHAIESVMNLRVAIDAVQQDFQEAGKTAVIVENKRRDARNSCWKLLKDLYHLPTDLPTLILTRELILDLVDLADLAEKFSDFIRTLVIKYSEFFK